VKGPVSGEEYRTSRKAANFGASLCSMNFQYPKFGRGSVGLARGEVTKTMQLRLRPGTVLMREHRGLRHTVTVIPDGFVVGEHVQIRPVRVLPFASTEAIVPENLDQRTALSAEHVEIAAMRITLEGFLHQQGQRVYAAAHVGARSIPGPPAELRSLPPSIRQRCNRRRQYRRIDCARDPHLRSARELDLDCAGTGQRNRTRPEGHRATSR
jgi:hypothetical protein